MAMVEIGEQWEQKDVNVGNGRDMGTMEQKDVSVGNG